jgi:hypothetical protein
MVPKEIPMSSKKWLLPLLLSLPLAALVLFLGGCLPVGLGDPEASKVDPRLVGVWSEAEEEEDDGEDGVVVLLPFDGRAYVLRSVEIERTKDGVEVKREGLYKAWLTTIEGRTFLTAQPLYLREAVEGKLPGFFVAQLKLSGDGTTVDVKGVDPSFPALAPLKALPGHMEYEPPAAGAKAPTEDEARALLRKVIAENLDDDELLSLAARYKRVTDKLLLKALFEGVFE